MRVMVNAALRKIKSAEEEGGAGAGGEGATTATPAKAATSGTLKRKDKDLAETMDDDEIQPAKKTLGRGRPKKQAAKPRGGSVISDGKGGSGIKKED